MVRVEIFNLPGVEFHLHYRQLFLHYAHRLFIVLSDIQSVVGIADVISAETGQTLVYMTEDHVGEPCSHGTSLLEGLVAAAQVALCVEVEVGVVIVADNGDERRFSVFILYPVECPVYE